MHLLQLPNDALSMRNKTNKNVSSCPAHDHIILSTVTLFSSFHQLVVLLSGDIEVNPGPPDNNLCIAHVNACSLRNKLALFEAECNKFDIITISETWLSDHDDSSQLLLPNFCPPVRLDRPGDAHGGVAIYIRDSLYCKARPDLTLPGLEAVWLETRLNYEPLLVGSFYRPPNANVAYWDLINENINKINDENKKIHNSWRFQ